MEDFIVKAPNRRLSDAINFASDAHDGQIYGGDPYNKHLLDVYNVLLEYGVREEDILVASLLHDIIEDTTISYNDIKSKFGENVAELVYAVTDELGRNRKERHEKTYPKIKNNTKAKILKLADRIANVRYSKKTGSSFMKLYQLENAEFYVGIGIMLDSSDNLLISKMVEDLTKILEVE